jgi:hypothetical protein
MSKGIARINDFFSNVAGRRFSVADLYHAAQFQPALRTAIKDAAAGTQKQPAALQPQPQPQTQPAQKPEPPTEPGPQWSESSGKFGAGTWG